MLSLIHAPETSVFRVERKRSSKGGGVAIILLGIKSMKRTEEGLWITKQLLISYPLKYWIYLLVTRCFSRNSSAGDKKYEREGGRGQGQGGGKRQGGKDEKPRYQLMQPMLENLTLFHHFRSRNASAAGRGRGGGPGGSRSNRAAKQQARLAKLARNYEVIFSSIYLWT